MSPSQQIQADANVVMRATDSAGRVLGVRRLGALDRLRLFKAVGPELAENAPYLGMAMLAASVIDIDAVPVPAPVSEAQVEALVQRLCDGGIAAVADCLAGAEAAAAKDTDPGN
jgi:hypothetical protein